MEIVRAQSGTCLALWSDGRQRSTSLAPSYGQAKTRLRCLLHSSLCPPPVLSWPRFLRIYVPPLNFLARHCAQLPPRLKFPPEAAQLFKVSDRTQSHPSAGSKNVTSSALGCCHNRIAQLSLLQFGVDSAESLRDRPLSALALPFESSMTRKKNTPATSPAHPSALTSLAVDSKNVR